MLCGHADLDVYRNFWWVWSYAPYFDSPEGQFDSEEARLRFT